MLDGINNIDDAMDKVVKDNPLNENFKDFYFKWRQAQKNQTS